ncbi:hypothetical protein [Microbispora sp. NPDC049125]|uniref:hypothetical protein n=1 Tax=Microbispora sp. NPDC049125 TaxID=3154929 RepID=UPI0034675612
MSNPPANTTSYFFADPAWDIPENSWWPEDAPLDLSDIGYDRFPKKTPDWRLDLCRDGTLSLRKKTEKPFNGVAITVYRHDDPDVLRDVQQLMCRKGYPGSEDKRLTHEGGTRWYFSWIALPGTLWQLNAATRVIHLYVTRGVRVAHEEAGRLNATVHAAAAELDQAARAAKN